MWHKPKKFLAPSNFFQICSPACLVQKAYFSFVICIHFISFFYEQCIISWCMTCVDLFWVMGGGWVMVWWCLGLSNKTGPLQYFSPKSIAKLNLFVTIIATSLDSSANIRNGCTTQITDTLKFISFTCQFFHFVLLNILCSLFRAKKETTTLLKW